MSTTTLQFCSSCQILNPEIHDFNDIEDYQNTTQCAQCVHLRKSLEHFHNQNRVQDTLFTNTRPSPPFHFTVMTWNLYRLQGFRVHDWPGERRDGMCRAITKLCPDVLCVQENAPEYLHAILKANRFYKTIVPCPGVVNDASRCGPARPQTFDEESKHPVLKHSRANPIHYDVEAKNASSSCTCTGKTKCFIGWLDEGNILWNENRFQYQDHGLIDIGLEQAEERGPCRRLFWVLLNSIPASSETIPIPIIFATAHFTWQGNSTEAATPYPNVRIDQAHRTGLQ